MSTRWLPVCTMLVGASLATLAAGESRLKTLGAQFDPLVEAVDLGPSEGLRQFELDPDAEGLLLVQLAAPIGEAERRLVEQAGFSLLRYVPDNAYLVRGTLRAAAILRVQPSVRWAGLLQPAMKVEPLLLERAFEQPVQIVAALADDEARLEVIGAVSAAAPTAKVTQTYSYGDGIVLVFEVQPSQVRTASVALANQHWVEAVTFTAEPEEHNNHSIYITQTYDIVNRTNYALSAKVWNKGILGTGQIIAVSDSGFDDDACQFAYSPVGGTPASAPVAPNPGPIDPSKKVVGHVLLGAATSSSDRSHGTHTAGTVAGDNFASLSTSTVHGHDNGDGLAPNAKLFLQDHSNSSGIVGSVVDPYKVGQQVINAGGSLATHSWGSSIHGGAHPYEYAAMRRDEFTWDNEEYLHIFSVGNHTLDGRIHVASPAIAKNVVGVAATTHGSSNSAAITSWSAYGPAADGRIKPDVAAPGDSITSAYGDLTSGNGTCSTVGKSGTSMAAPTVAGSTALLRQYFMDGFYPTGAKVTANGFRPSAALLKAMLINGANDLQTADIPTIYEGWGRIRLDNALFFSGDPEALRVWDKRNRIGLTTGQQDSYTLKLTSGIPFKITLVWSDPPASLGAANNLVNNLDLEVVAPDATVYRGNVLSGGASVSGGVADTLNNVEQVILNPTATGTYTVRVKGTSVPGNGFSRGSTRQGYALVATRKGCTTNVTAVPSNTRISANNATGVTVAWNKVKNATYYELNRADGTCAAPTGAYSYIGSASSLSFVDALAPGGYTYSYKVRGFNECGSNAGTSCVDVTSAMTCTLVPQFDGVTTVSNNTATPGCDLTVSWGAATSRCPTGASIRYNVYRGSTPYFTPSASNRVASGLLGTSFTDTGVTSLQPAFYIVRAEDSTTGNAGPNGGNEDGNTTAVGSTPTSTYSAGIFVDDAGDSKTALLLDGGFKVSNEQNHTAGGGLSYKSGLDGIPYPAGACAVATTPPITLQPGASELRYWMNYETEAFYDGFFTEISTDGGLTWAVLEPTVSPAGGAGFPSNCFATNNCAITPGIGCFSGPPEEYPGMSGWYEVIHDLTVYAGQTVQVRWRFFSDSNKERTGLYLDDITISGGSAGGACSP